MISKEKVQQLLHSIYDIQESALTSTIDGLLLRQVALHCTSGLEISIQGYAEVVVFAVANKYRTQSWKIEINRDNPENPFMEIK